MKVLFIGPLRDASGWARNAQDQILALDAAGVEVVARCVRFADAVAEELPPRLLELERRPARGCDVVIQNALPPAMVRGPGFRKQVGYYFLELSPIDPEWARHVELMDEAWVPCRHNLAASREGGVTVPIAVVPCSTDVTRYERDFPPHRIREERPGSFLFYTIGDGKRKGLRDVVTAFHLAFAPTDPVELVIKTSVPGMEAGAARHEIEGDLLRLEAELNLYRNPLACKRPIVITERLSDEEILRLHASCDCFVTASRGEGWCLPALDAMAMGKTPIYPDHGGLREFLSDRTGYPVGGRLTPAVDAGNPHYSARQDWFAVDLHVLIRQLQAAYSASSTERLTMAAAGMTRAYDFARPTVGRLMRERLEP